MAPRSANARRALHPQRPALVAIHRAAQEEVRVIAATVRQLDRALRLAQTEGAALPFVPGVPVQTETLTAPQLLMHRAQETVQRLFGLTRAAVETVDRATRASPYAPPHHHPRRLRRRIPLRRRGCRQEDPRGERRAGDRAVHIAARRTACSALRGVKPQPPQRIRHVTIHRETNHRQGA